MHWREVGLIKQYKFDEMDYIYIKPNPFQLAWKQNLFYWYNIGQLTGMFPITASETIITNRYEKHSVQQNHRLGRFPAKTVN